MMRMDKYKDESMPNFHALVFPLCPPCPEFGHEEHKDLHKGHRRFTQNMAILHR